MLTLQLLILAGGVSVELPTEAEATGTMITLGEIAEVTSADPAALAAVNGVELGYMPAPGYSRTLQRWKIERAVALAAPDVEVTWAGEKACKWRRSSHGIRVSGARCAGRKKTARGRATKTNNA